MIELHTSFDFELPCVVDPRWQLFGVQLTGTLGPRDFVCFATSGEYEGVAANLIPRFHRSAGDLDEIRGIGIPGKGRHGSDFRLGFVAYGIAAGSFRGADM